jgi:hypothetical protein
MYRLVIEYIKSAFTSIGSFCCDLDGMRALEKILEQQRFKESIHKVCP